VQIRVVSSSAFVLGGDGERGSSPKKAAPPARRSAPPPNRNREDAEGNAATARLIEQMLAEEGANLDSQAAMFTHFEKQQRVKSPASVSSPTSFDPFSAPSSPESAGPRSPPPYTRNRTSSPPRAGGPPRRTEDNFHDQRRTSETGAAPRQSQSQFIGNNIRNSTTGCGAGAGVDGHGSTYYDMPNRSASGGADSTRRASASTRPPSKNSAQEQRAQERRQSTKTDSSAPKDRSSKSKKAPAKKAPPPVEIDPEEEKRQQELEKKRRQIREAARACQLAKLQGGQESPAKSASPSPVVKQRVIVEKARSPTPKAAKAAPSKASAGAMPTDGPPSTSAKAASAASKKDTEAKNAAPTASG
ncbi:unnamed protein product, partial [Amoebophrya sp. A25]